MDHLASLVFLIQPLQPYMKRKFMKMILYPELPASSFKKIPEVPI